jgi:DNA mismatch repair ATPase MutS
MSYTSFLFNFSLYDYSFGLDDDGSCFPKFHRITCDDKPSLNVVEGRHPIVIATNPDMAFIPNSFELDDRLAILTGANMGNQFKTDLGPVS